MHAEHAFTKQSLKRYKAFKKAVLKVAPRDLLVIVGRERAILGLSDTVYVEVRSVRNPGHARFYFEGDMTNKQVTRAVEKVLAVWK